MSKFKLNWDPILFILLTINIIIYLIIMIVWLIYCLKYSSCITDFTKNINIRFVVIFIIIFVLFILYFILGKYYKWDNSKESSGLLIFQKSSILINILTTIYICYFIYFLVE